MSTQADFIYKNIHADLLSIGHSEAVATQVANSARLKYLNGSNWPTGKVYAVLQKEARKQAGKVIKSRTGK